LFVHVVVTLDSLIQKSSLYLPSVLEAGDLYALVPCVYRVVCNIFQQAVHLIICPRLNLISIINEIMLSSSITRKTYSTFQLFEYSQVIHNKGLKIDQYLIVNLDQAWIDSLGLYTTKVPIIYNIQIS